MKKIHIIIIGGGGQKVNKDNINISVIIRVSNEERWIGHCIQSVIDKLSDHPIPRDVGDFRLLDRKVINSLSKMQMAKPYLPIVPNKLLSLLPKAHPHYSKPH